MICREELGEAVGIALRAPAFRVGVGELWGSVAMCAGPVAEGAAASALPLDEGGALAAESVGEGLRMGAAFTTL